MKFENCAEAISAGNEIVSVFYSTSNKAFNENDAKAKSDLEHFEELINAYDEAIEPMWKKCPEILTNGTEKTEKRLTTFCKSSTPCKTPMLPTVFFLKTSHRKLKR